ncbi:alpha/beta fold hydrolase [Nocardia sp. alder85J]|uniref:alpha/beta fold hydrolase n=1 Tax=Nocardia sp. alder85J TaxID=2862949 RepID=UPI001CD26362|nr:alpha/beta hydrolase [Nocardia sp. alder85J]MCX4099162.1 alpha/beta hydrolase [Nocardia sp. alder85J]
MGTYRFTTDDGVELAWHEIGSGRPLILLPGFGGSSVRLLEYGPAATLAARGHRVILPDFRGSGDSAAVHDSAGYPPDALADDQFALLGHLGLGDGDYDLGGYSLGARIAIRMLARGATPRRAIAAGQGLAKVSGPQGGGANQRVLTALVAGTAFEPDSPDARTARMITMGGADPRALLGVLGSLVPTPEAALGQITVPVLVAIGDRDERADADELAALLPNATFVRVPGDHGSAFVAPELATAIIEFLAEP